MPDNRIPVDPDVFKALTDRVQDTQRLLRERLLRAVFDEFDGGLMRLGARKRREKYERMAESPFRFFRGSAYLFYFDAAGEWFPYHTEPDRPTWIQGDLHFENFGAFMNERGRLVYDVNDFDEGYVGSYLYDLLRMSVSVSLVGRSKGYGRAERLELAEAYLRAYYRQMRRFAGGKDDPATYLVDEERAKGPVRKLLKKLRKRRAGHFLEKVTASMQQRRRPAGGDRSAEADSAAFVWAGRAEDAALHAGAAPDRGIGDADADSDGVSAAFVSAGRAEDAVLHAGAASAVDDTPAEPSVAASGARLRAVPAEEAEADPAAGMGAAGAAAGEAQDEAAADGKRKFAASAEIVPLTGKQREAIEAAWPAYRAMLEAPYAEQAVIKDIAVKHGSGTASIGLDRYYVLIEGGRGEGELDDIVLEMKEVRVPVPAYFLPYGESFWESFGHQGARVIATQRAMHHEADPFLGYLTIDGRDYYVRERSPYKKRLKLDAIESADGMADALACMGRITAKMHARADADVEQGVLGYHSEEAIVRAMGADERAFAGYLAAWAEGYADRVEADYELFAARHAEWAARGRRGAGR